MRFLIVLTLVLVVGPIGQDSNGPIFQSYEFPSYPNLTHLCQQRVYGSGHEITWDAFASVAKPSTLVDYYQRKLGDAGLTRKGEGASWRLPADAPRPNRILEVMAIGTENPSRACAKSPPSKSSAIVLLSRMN